MTYEPTTPPIPDHLRCLTCRHTYQGYWLRCPKCGDHNARITHLVPLTWAGDQAVIATLLGGILLGIGIGLTLAAALGWIPPAA